jgi:hypothetical protein
MQVPQSLDALLAQPRSILLECVSGSHAYGLNRPGSDRDVRGIFALPAAVYLGLDEPPVQLSDARGDVTFFALRRFGELAAAANPNMLELLFSPDDCVVRASAGGRRLIAERSLFLSRACFQSHVAYANAQIHKAKGQNKWVNRPQPVEPPTAEDSPESVGQDPPVRPVRLADAPLRLAECHAAALEHCTELYRLYHYGAAARGVFRGGNLVPESIPLADEAKRFAGLLIYNRNAYDAALRDHRNYWKWREERNPARWETQESGQIDYDAKNLMHTFRLLLAAEGLLREGTLRVRVTGADRDFLLAVRAGEYSYQDLIADAERRTACLAELLPDSPLPEKPDFRAIDSLIREITEEWECDHP